MAEKYLVGPSDEEVSYELRWEGEKLFARREGWEDWKSVHLEAFGEAGLCLLLIDNRPTELYLDRRRGGALVTIGRHTFDYDVGPWRPQTQKKHAAEAGNGTAKLVAPMTGTIIEVKCAAGDIVTAGQVLLVVESMKMNNELKAPVAGSVTAVSVAAGQKVKAGDLLVTLGA
jgi:biotin carboxyl carrier protein